MGKNRIKRMFTRILNPLNITCKIQSVLRHWRYPKCSSKALIYKPLLITPEFMILGKGVSIFANALIQGISKYAGDIYEPCIRIGEGTSIRQNAHITCASSITIGTYCAITHNVTITDIDHSFEYSPFNYPPPYR